MFAIVNVNTFAHNPIMCLVSKFSIPNSYLLNFPALPTSRFIVKIESQIATSWLKDNICVGAKIVKKREKKIGGTLINMRNNAIS